MKKNFICMSFVVQYAEWVPRESVNNIFFTCVLFVTRHIPKVYFHPDQQQPDPGPDTAGPIPLLVPVSVWDQDQFPPRI